MDFDKIISDSWKMTNPQKEVGSLMSILAMKHIMDKPEALTRKVMIEKTEKNAWLFGQFAVNFDDLFKNSLMNSYIGGLDLGSGLDLSFLDTE